MVPSQLIRRKREGEALAPEELAGFLKRFAAGDIPDYQMAAFLMAVYFQGLDGSELNVLVDAILGSGERVHFDGPGPYVDKHSTGGVGDTVSLILAPLVASLGVPVPMMSGRGLGHSGGTVDKLESIPGMRLDLSLDQFKRQVEDLGIALISQTPEITPLDGKLYALRDVTATVESIPLIASSIMSKKIAEGIDGLVLDVKVGNGSFMPEEDRALELARTMIDVGVGQGLSVVVLATAMDRPLGRAIGNALEVVEAVDCLQGGGPADLREVTLALAAEMLVLGGAAGHLEGARELAARALDDGRALDLLQQVVDAQGGDPAVIDDPARLAPAPVQRAAEAGRSGRVVAMETRAIGEAAMALGAGRSSMEYEIDPAVGFVMAVGAGDKVESGQPLARIHARDQESAARAAGALQSAIHIDDASEPAFRPLISHRVTAEGVETL